MAYPPDALHRAITAALGKPSDFVADKAALPDEAGAYLLALRLSAAVELRIPHFLGKTLEPGCYVYAGSACGPGGIAARAGRHLRPEKAVRWHIDHLTTAAETVRASAFPDATECGLVEQLMSSDGFETPLPGFGSSDCRTCQAHLLRFREPVMVCR
ncbi:MAG: GIY-YIG nuclease family protein [Hyphomicrobiales bacterium]